MPILEILFSMRLDPHDTKLNAQLIHELKKIAKKMHTLYLETPSGFWSGDFQTLFRALSKVPHLKSLDISVPMMPFPSAYHYLYHIPDCKALADVLQTNTTLTTVNFENKKITVSDLVALAKTLTSNFTLKQLKFSGYYMLDGHVLALAEFLRSVNSRLITPELLVVSNTRASKESLEILDAAFIEHAQRMCPSKKTTKEILYMYSPAALLVPIQELEVEQPEQPRSGKRKKLSQ